MANLAKQPPTHMQDIGSKGGNSTLARYGKPHYGQIAHNRHATGKNRR